MTKNVYIQVDSYQRILPLPESKFLPAIAQAGSAERPPDYTTSKSMELFDKHGTLKTPDTLDPVQVGDKISYECMAGKFMSSGNVKGGVISYSFDCEEDGNTGTFYFVPNPNDMVEECVTEKFCDKASITAPTQEMTTTFNDQNTYRNDESFT